MASENDVMHDGTTHACRPPILSHCCSIEGLKQGILSTDTSTRLESWSPISWERWIMILNPSQAFIHFARRNGPSGPSLSIYCSVAALLYLLECRQPSIRKPPKLSIDHIAAVEELFIWALNFKPRIEPKVCRIR